MAATSPEAIRVVLDRVLRQIGVSVPRPGD
jgi:hypothetical protein